MYHIISRTFFLCTLLGFTPLVASLAGEPATRGAPAIDVREIWQVVNDNCAGNGGGRTAVFDPRELDLQQEMLDLRASDRGCLAPGRHPGRRYSRSRPHGVRIFKEFLRTDYYAKDCVPRALGGSLEPLLRILDDTDATLAVLASVYDDHPDSEGCSYYRFNVYRADGVMVQFEFNYTD